MIKKFKLFLENIDLKPKYQFLHLNNKQKIEYLIQRIEEFKETQNGSLQIYELEYLPSNLRKIYFDLCIQKNYIFDKEELLEAPSEKYINDYIKNRFNYLKEINHYIEDFEWDFCTQDLKNEYVNIWINQGSGLSEHMLSELSDDINKRYKFNNYFYEKILDSNELSKDEFEACTLELKKFYLYTNVRNKFGCVEKDILDICPKNLLINYFDKVIEKGRYLDNTMFSYCTEEQKNKYLIKRINKTYMITDLQFNFLSDEYKNIAINTYISNMYKEKLIDVSFTDFIFNFCTDEQKESYIIKTISKFSTIRYITTADPKIITPNQFKWCSDKLKQLIIDSKLSENLGLEKGELKYASLEKRKEYLEKIFKKEDFFYLKEEEFELCSEEQQYEYIDFYLKKDGDINNNKFLMFSDKQKIYVINNNGTEYRFYEIIDKLSFEVQRVFLNKKLIDGKQYQLIKYIDKFDIKLQHAYIDYSIKYKEYINIDKLSDELKKYLINNYSDHYILSSTFINFSSEIKLMYIKKLIENNNDLTIDIFKECSSELKILYLNNINNRLFSIYSDSVFDDQDIEVKKAYVDYIVRNNRVHTREFDRLSDELKLYFIERLNFYKKGLNYHIQDWFDNYKKKL